MKNKKEIRCNAVLEHFLNDKDYSIKKLPCSICHYSRLDIVLKDILHKKVGTNEFEINLRYNQTEYMNDKRELEVGKQLFNNITHNNFVIFNENSVQKSLKDEGLIACFTQKVDDIYFWKKYGNEGKGACIVYKGECLYSDNSDKSVFGLCKYFELDKKGMLVMNDDAKSFVSKYQQIYDNAEDYDVSYDDAVTHLFRFLCLLSKNAEYACEEEVRFFYLPENTQSIDWYIHTNGKKRQFIDEHYSIDIIDCIILGPCVPQNIYDELKSTFKDLGLKIELRKSKVHYKS